MLFSYICEGQGQGQTSRSPKCHSVAVKLCLLTYVLILVHVNLAVCLVEAIYSMTSEFWENCQGQGQGQIKIQWYHRIPWPSKPHPRHQNRVSTTNSKKVTLMDVKSDNGGRCQGQGYKSRSLNCWITDAHWVPLTYKTNPVWIGTAVFPEPLTECFRMGVKVKVKVKGQGHRVGKI